ncbi:MAG TPA: DinB family protein [Candidatus Eisenbacteria bacterium]|nr:DinB family protein [Candidatus Eisenbacteria bacterium]
MTKSEFLSLRRAEFPKTLKLLRMYPEEKKDLKPSPIIRSAIETLNTFINEEGINLSYAQTGAFDMAGFAWAAPPSTMADGIAKLEALALEVDAALERMSEEDFQQPTEFFGMKMLLSEAMLLMLLDHIHHRGQFTIYSRIAGAKVPQIYGPSADEPWQPPQ